MDQMETWNISQDDNESDTSQEDLHETNSEAFQEHFSGGEQQSGCDRVDRKYKEIFQKWARQEAAKLDAVKPLKFMLLDSDFSIISTAKVDPLVVSILPQSLRSQVEQSYNRLYGVTEDGQSVLANAFGFVPYFYVLPSHAHASAFTQYSIEQFRQALNTEILKHIQNRLESVIPYHDIVHNSPPILVVEAISTSDVNIYEFHQAQTYSKADHLLVTPAEESNPVHKIKPGANNGMAGTDTGTQSKKILKVLCRMPKFVWAAVKILQERLISFPIIDGQPCQYLTFEGSINHNIRFLTDMNLCGCSWLEIPPGKYFRRSLNSKLSHCQIEVDAFYQSIAPAPNQSETIPPLRILSFDIECMTRPPNFSFPRNGSDLVLQIGAILTTHQACLLSRMSNANAMEKFMFMLGSCDELEDTHVFSFENETEMLDAWRLFVTATDPDILMGFNIKGFDIPFLLDRANVIKAKTLPFLGRIKTSECTARPIKNESKKPVKYDEKAINVAGRIIFDMMILTMRHNTKPGRCRLGDVASRYLKSNETKEDISYRDIFKLQNMGPASRKKLASYCVQDARLPYLIMLEHNPNPSKSSDFDTLSYYVNKARESGTPLRYLVTKSPEYDTYYKLIRKHKNPAVTFVPNTPAKAPLTLEPTSNDYKRRHSTQPYFTGTAQPDLAEIPLSSKADDSSSRSNVKKLCARKELFCTEKEASTGRQDF